MAAPSIKIERVLYALTMDAERRILTDAAVLIEGDTITRVGKSSDMADVNTDTTIDASDFVLTPTICRTCSGSRASCPLKRSV